MRWQGAHLKKGTISKQRTHLCEKSRPKKPPITQRKQPGTDIGEKKVAVMHLWQQIWAKHGRKYKQPQLLDVGQDHASRPQDPKTHPIRTAIVKSAPPMPTATSVALCVCAKAMTGYTQGDHQALLILRGNPDGEKIPVVRVGEIHTINVDAPTTPAATTRLASAVRPVPGNHNILPNR